MAARERDLARREQELAKMQQAVAAQAKHSIPSSPPPQYQQSFTSNFSMPSPTSLPAAAPDSIAASRQQQAQVAAERKKRRDAVVEALAERARFCRQRLPAHQCFEAQRQSLGGGGLGELDEDVEDELDRLTPTDGPSDPYEFVVWFARVKNWVSQLDLKRERQARAKRKQSLTKGGVHWEASVRSPVVAPNPGAGAGLFTPSSHPPVDDSGTTAAVATAQHRRGGWYDLDGVWHEGYERPVHQRDAPAWPKGSQGVVKWFESFEATARLGLWSLSQTISLLGSALPTEEMKRWYRELTQVVLREPREDQWAVLTNHFLQRFEPHTTSSSIDAMNELVAVRQQPTESVDDYLARVQELGDTYVRHQGVHLSPNWEEQLISYFMRGLRYELQSAFRYRSKHDPQTLQAVVDYARQQEGHQVSETSAGRTGLGVSAASQSRKARKGAAEVAVAAASSSPAAVGQQGAAAGAGAGAGAGVSASVEGGVSQPDTAGPHQLQQQQQLQLQQFQQQQLQLQTQLLAQLGRAMDRLDDRDGYEVYEEPERLPQHEAQPHYGAVAPWEYEEVEVFAAQAGGQFQGQCHNCGLVGHRAAQCATAGGQGVPGSLPAVTCWRCGEVGHTSPQCQLQNAYCTRCQTDSHNDSACAARRTYQDHLRRTQPRQQQRWGAQQRGPAGGGRGAGVRQLRGGVGGRGGPPFHQQVPASAWQPATAHHQQQPQVPGWVPVQQQQAPMPQPQQQAPMPQYQQQQPGVLPVPSVPQQQQRSQQQQMQRPRQQQPPQQSQQQSQQRMQQQTQPQVARRQGGGGQQQQSSAASRLN